MVCCTTARTPLFDGALLPAHATVVAVGSHGPDAVEVDAMTVAAATVVVEAVVVEAVVVEAVETAPREAGGVLQPARAGLLDPGTLLDLVTVVRGRDRPRLFTSVGMVWEDLAAAAYQPVWPASRRSRVRTP